MTVLMLTIILGSVMYLVEQKENGFSNIPESIYWAIVTITTVGYGDISPITPLGKLVAAVVMLIGYSIIAVYLATIWPCLPAQKKNCLSLAQAAAEMDTIWMQNSVNSAGFIDEGLKRYS